MDSGITLFIALGMILVIGIAIQFVFWKMRERDKNSIDEHWKRFQHAIERNNIEEIQYFGDKLVWNKHLKQHQLTTISEVVTDRIERYPQLEQLKLHAFNKQLHYDRALPY